MTIPNAAFDALLSTTLDNFHDQLDDNISSQVALWYWLKEGDRVQTKSGGAKVIEPLLYAQNSTSKTYGLYEDLDITPQDGISAAEYDWKTHAVSVAIAGLEEAMNSGEQEVIDLLQAKITQAEITASEDFGAMFASDGTGNSGKDFLGIAALIGDESSTVTTVGGIDCTVSTNAFWRSDVTRTVGTLAITDLEHSFNKAVRGPSKPTFGISGVTLYEKHISLLQANQRFTDPKMASAGFDNLMFHGATCVWDDNLETNEVGSFYFLNPKYFGLKKLGSKWLKATPFQTPVNRDARYSQILSYGQLTVSNRRLAGSKLEDATA